MWSIAHPSNVFDYILAKIFKYAVNQVRGLRQICTPRTLICIDARAREIHNIIEEGHVGKIKSLRHVFFHAYLRAYQLKLAVDISHVFCACYNVRLYKSLKWHRALVTIDDYIDDSQCLLRVVICAILYAVWNCASFCYILAPC